MKTQFLAFISSFFILLSLSGCNNCAGNIADTQMPKTLEKTVLTGIVSSATGAFSGMEGYSFKTAFDKNRSFQTTTGKNATESRGDYSYSRVDDTTARLTLIDQSTLHSGEQIEVLLSFSSRTQGTFEAHFISGPPGSQTGTFELQNIK